MERRLLIRRPHYLFTDLSTSGLIQRVRNDAGAPLFVFARLPPWSAAAPLVIASLLDYRLHPIIGTFTKYSLS